MRAYPAFLELRDRPVLVVGAGPVALRKLTPLLAAGAKPVVVAPEAVPGIEDLARAGDVQWHRRRFRAGDVAGHWLVINACGAPGVAAAVRRAGERERVFVNSVDDPERCSFTVPAVVDRDPVMVAISSAGTAPVLARRIRERIEAMLPASTGALARTAGRWRARVAGTLPDGAARRRFWERWFDGAGVHGGADAELQEALVEAAGSGGDTGVAWLVGAGPGDPGLLTLKALQALQDADVILHDRLVSDDILGLARRDAERVSVGKVPGCRDNSQASINARLVALVADGKRVCRLKGGDPFVFGRGGEEAEALDAAGLPYVVVPGITAALGCAAAAGIPLTHRDAAQSLTLLTGHGRDAVDRIDWAALARGRQTLAIYMGVQRFPDLMQKLTAHGRAADTPVAIIERGTLPTQRVLRGTLGQLALLASAHRVEAPALLIVGEVAGYGASRTGAPDLRPRRAAPSPTSESAINRATPGST